jgi:outer membrane protein
MRRGAGDGGGGIPRATVGQDAGALSAMIAPPATLPATIDEARGAAEAGNPLLAQRWRIAASAAQVDQARAERAPSIDLAGSYGRGARIGDGAAHGFAAFAAVGMAFRMPLLTGGLVPSRIRAAEALNRAERLDGDAAAREALRGTDAAWAALVAARARLRTNDEGLAAADLALRGVRAEYGFDLRSTLDILVADQSFRSAQLAVALARADVLVAEAGLLRATGRMTRASFG